MAPDPADLLDPTEADLKMSCPNGHRWREAWPLPMEIAEFASRMKAVETCPACGEKSLLGWPEERP